MPPRNQRTSMCAAYEESLSNNNGASKVARGVGGAMIEGEKQMASSPASPPVSAAAYLSPARESARAPAGQRPNVIENDNEPALTPAASATGEAAHRESLHRKYRGTLSASAPAESPVPKSIAHWGSQRETPTDIRGRREAARRRRRRPAGRRDAEGETRRPRYARLDGGSGKCRRADGRSALACRARLLPAEKAPRIVLRGNRRRAAGSGAKS